MTMNKFGIEYAITFAGHIDVSAKSLDEVFKAFDDLAPEQLLDNCVDLIEVEIYSIDQYSS
jgi:hypothetical protein